MSKPLVIAASILMALQVPAFADATAPEKVKSAANATVHGLEKAQDVVVHGAKVGVAGATHGVNKAGGAVTHVAKKVGLPTEQGSPPKEPTTPTQ